MIALARFQFSAYVRSRRALHPFIALLLLLAIMFDGPMGDQPRQGVLTAFGDLAALAFPIWAWAARGLLDTEPDTQRHLSATAAGRLSSTLGAGLLAAYAFNVCLAFIAVAYPLGCGLTYGVRPIVMWLAIALQLLSTLAATMVGALTSRAVIPSAGTSILWLLGGCASILLLGVGPLRIISVPMIEWMRAANHGPSAFTAAFPGLAVRILVWAVLAAAGYAWTRRTRP